MGWRPPATHPSQSTLLTCTGIVAPRVIHARASRASGSPGRGPGTRSNRRSQNLAPPTLQTPCKMPAWIFEKLGEGPALVKMPQIWRPCWRKPLLRGLSRGWPAQHNCFLPQAAITSPAPARSVCTQIAWQRLQPCSQLPAASALWHAAQRTLALAPAKPSASTRWLAPERQAREALLRWAGLLKQDTIMAALCTPVSSSCGFCTPCTAAAARGSALDCLPVLLSRPFQPLFGLITGRKRS